MDSRQRIVTSLPLAELWDSAKPLDARRVRDVGQSDIVELLQNGSNMVVADIGQPLRWLFADDRFAFWRSEVEGRLVAPEPDRFSLDDYPRGYCYVAALWLCVPPASVIVLEKHH